MFTFLRRVIDFFSDYNPSKLIIMCAIIGNFLIVSNSDWILVFVLFFIFFLILINTLEKLHEMCRIYRTRNFANFSLLLTLVYKLITFFKEFNTRNIYNCNQLALAHHEREVYFQYLLFATVPHFTTNDIQFWFLDYYYTFYMKRHYYFVGRVKK